MMFPRLILARNLLTDDGVIFVSIDDTELTNLQALCNDVFGEENFIDIFNWAKTETPENLSTKSKQIVEYILCYQKIKNDKKFKGIKKKSQSSNGLLNQPNAVGVLTFPENIVQTSIPDRIIPKGMYGTDTYDVELLEDTEVHDGVFIKPVKLKARFKWQQSYLDNELRNGTKIKIPTMKFSPSYEKIEYDAEVPANLINSKVNVGTNENAGEYQIKLFGNKVFNYPKPVSLIKYLIGFNDDNEDGIILDFFSGSATTADAVLQLNAEIFSSKNYILVQLPERLCDALQNAKTPSEKEIIQNAIDLCREQHGNEDLCTVAKERIRRVAQKIREDLQGKITVYTDNRTQLQDKLTKAQAGMLFGVSGESATIREDIQKLDEQIAEAEKSLSGDMGFRVFKLDTSNYIPWHPESGNIELLLRNAVDNILTDRTRQDLLYEILLKNNLPLTLPIEERKIGENTVYTVGGVLAICLDLHIPQSLAEDIIQLRDELAPIVPMQVILRDNGLTDVVKTNILQILKQAGFEETSVRTI